LREADGKDARKFSDMRFRNSGVRLSLSIYMATEIFLIRCYSGSFRRAICNGICNGICVTAAVSQFPITPFSGLRNAIVARIVVAQSA
jgi:hypothetical protein